jgi:hypothetical protein
MEGWAKVGTYCEFSTTTINTMNIWGQIMDEHGFEELWKGKREINNEMGLGKLLENKRNMELFAFVFNFGNQINNVITTRVLIDKTGWSLRICSDFLSALVDFGLLQRIGTKNHYNYILIDKKRWESRMNGIYKKEGDENG